MTCFSTTRTTPSPRSAKANVIDYVIPPQTILIQNPIAVLTNSSHKAAAQAFVNYLLSEAGQELWAKEGYRPVIPSAAAAAGVTFPTPSDLFTIDSLGGWTKVAKFVLRSAQPESVAKIEQSLGVSTSSVIFEIDSAGGGRTAERKFKMHTCPWHNRRARMTAGTFPADLPGTVDGANRRGHAQAIEGLIRSSGPGAAVIYLSLLVLIPIAALASQAFTRRMGRVLVGSTQPGVLGGAQAHLAERRDRRDREHLCGNGDRLGPRARQLPRARSSSGRSSTCPFALPTVIAGLTLLTLYGPDSPIHLDVADTRLAVWVALAFVTLPFAVSSIQPVLEELDLDAEEAAASLGASSFTVFRRVVLPSLAPAMISGASLVVRPGAGRVRIAGAVHERAPVQDDGRVDPDLRALSSPIETRRRQRCRSCSSCCRSCPAALGSLRRHLTRDEVSG